MKPRSVGDGFSREDEVRMDERKLRKTQIK